MKYKLTREKKEFYGTTLRRIKALKNFGNVSKGELGGWVEKEENLSQSGVCWVSDNAIVCDNSRVSDNAIVFDNARVFGSARVCGSAEVFGNARVSDNARVYDNAKVFGSAYVYGDTDVYGNASVYGNAIVCDSAIVCDNAITGENQRVIGKLTKDITENKNKNESLYAQILHYPTKGKIILFKRVLKTEKNGVYKSCYDVNFIYKLGKIAKIAENIDEKDTVSCGKGLHFSHLMYCYGGDTTIACEIDMKDVITIQNGKVRATKCKVIEEIK